VGGEEKKFAKKNKPTWADEGKKKKTKVNLSWPPWLAQ
jgi:hypothetical protein